jgi:hypothetical protein
VQPVKDKAVARLSMTIKAFFITHSSRTFKPKLNFQNGQRETQLEVKMPSNYKNAEIAKIPQNLASSGVKFL